MRTAGPGNGETVPACALILRVRAAAALLVGGRTWRLDWLTIEHLRACLQDRRTRWPASADPCLLINRSTAAASSPSAGATARKPGAGPAAGHRTRVPAGSSAKPRRWRRPAHSSPSVRDQRPCGRGRRPAYRAPPGSAGPAFQTPLNRGRLHFVNKMGGSDAARAFSLP